MRLSSALAAALLVSAASSQGKVWIVDDNGGPGVDFTVLQDAVDAAADGDVLLLKAGTYGSCNLINRGMTIVADTGAVVNVGQLNINQLQSGKTARIQGLMCTSGRFEFDPGEVWIEDTSFSPPPSTNHVAVDGIAMAACASVVLVSVEATGQVAKDDFSYPFFYPVPGSGAAVTSSNLSAYQCKFTGAAGTAFWTGGGSFTPGAGGTGLRIEGASSVELSATTATGGKGTTTSGSLGCFSAEGGTGLSAFGIAPACPDVALQGCIILGGPGEDPIPFISCPGGPAGPTMGVSACANVTQVSADTSSMVASSPVRETASLAVVITAPAQVPVALGVSSTPHAYFTPALGASLAISPPYLVVVLGVTSVTGDLSVSLPLHGMPPGVDSMVFHGQVAYLDASGQGVLGQAGMVVLLDDSF